jgi:YD repeat-containing protein
VVTSAGSYQQFNVENRLVAVTNTVSGQVTRFTYDGDGARVLEVSSNITTAFVGEHYEKVSNVVTPTKYFMLGGKRIAVRNVSGLYYPSTPLRMYRHGDHPSTRSGCTWVQAA